MSRELVPFKMPLKGEYGMSPLQTLCLGTQIGLPPHQARPDEPPCNSPPRLQQERQTSSQSEIDDWVHSGRLTERPPAAFMMPLGLPTRDSIAENASDTPALSAVAPERAVRQCATKMDVTAPGSPASAVTIDIERFSYNFVHLIEQGCKAIAACLEAPEHGRPDVDTAGEMIGLLSTFGHVAEYCFTHPHHAIEVQSNLGKTYLNPGCVGGYPRRVKRGGDQIDLHLAEFQ